MASEVVVREGSMVKSQLGSLGGVEASRQQCESSGETSSILHGGIW
jgi:hypothetical protein